MQKHEAKGAREKLHEWLLLEPGMKVLEIGCGTGLNFRNYLPNIEYYGLDINREMLNIARKRADKNSLDISFITGNALNILFVLKVLIGS